MKKSLLLSVLGFVISSQLFASEQVYLNDDLGELETAIHAQIIGSRTSIGLTVEGTLQCQVISREVPPYDADSYCEFTVNGKSYVIDNHDFLIKSLQEIKPMTGPYWDFNSNFKYYYHGRFSSVELFEIR